MSLYSQLILKSPIFWAVLFCVRLCSLVFTCVHVESISLNMSLYYIG